MAQTKVSLEFEKNISSKQKELLRELNEADRLLSSEIRNKILSSETSLDELEKISRVIKQIINISKK